MHDPNLIRSARAGDSAAWADLVHAHYEPVFRLAYLILGDPADADDTAQETFIRAHKYFDRYDPERPLRPWLFSIGANLARNRQRALSRRYAAAKRLFQKKQVLDSPPDIEKMTEAQLESHRLWQAIQTLSDDDQTIIYLRYFLELPVAETAETLEIAQGTVKSRLYRALEKLRAVIESDYPDLQLEFSQ